MGDDENQGGHGVEGQVRGNVPGLVDAPVVVFVGNVVEEVFALDIACFDVAHGGLVVAHGKNHVDNDEFCCGWFEAWIIVDASEL